MCRLAVDLPWKPPRALSLNQLSRLCWHELILKGRNVEVNLTAAHWVYLAGILVILATMMLRKNIVVPAVLGTFLTAFVFSDSLVTGLRHQSSTQVSSPHNMFNIFLIIALVTAHARSVAVRWAPIDSMVAPFRKVMRGGTSSFLPVLAAVTYMISLFFWPTPAVPLIGAVLDSGRNPRRVSRLWQSVCSIAICGQGMALSADYIIKVAPGLSRQLPPVSILMLLPTALLSCH